MNHFKHTRKPTELVTILTAILCCNYASAAYDITDLDLVNIWDYTWSSADPNDPNLNIEATADFCIESRSGNTARPFNLSIDDAETPGTLQITNTTTNDNIPVSFSVLSNGTNFDLTNPGTLYGQYPGDGNIAAPGCGNSTIAATLSKNGYPDPGIYTGDFTLSSEHIFQLWVFQFPIANDTIGFNLRIEDLVRVSALEDLDTWLTDGSGFAIATTPVCLFRNGPNPSVSLNIESGNNPTTGSTLNLVGPTSIPYTFELYQGATLINSRTTSGLLSSTLSGSNIKGCGGTPNYSARAKINENLLLSEPQGTYTDTITLRATAN